MDDELMADLFAAVGQQLESPRTTYVKEAFDRLRTSGSAEDDAKKQIAEVLGELTGRMLEEREPFDEQGYREALAELR